MDWYTLADQIGLPLIAVLVPIVIAAFKALIPRIPTWALPLIAPLLGAGGDVAIGVLAGVESSGLAGALAGLAGVGVREVVDQARKALPT
jgi:hypothetical protein